MKIKMPLGLVLLAIGAIIHGGSKPPGPTPPPKPSEELVIIVYPIQDGMYSTRYLTIKKEEADELRSH